MPPKSTPPTHFLCIPLVNPLSRPQLASSIASFKANATSPASFAVPAQAVRPVGTLHLTLGVMSFPKKEEVERAVGFLRRLNLKQILQGSGKATTVGTAAEGSRPGSRKAINGPLKITLKGIRSMQPAQKTSLLYSPPEYGDGTLQRFCEKLREAFREAELMQMDDRPLLLHATLVNTVYVKETRKGKKWGKKVTFDAAAVIDRYEDQVWMRDFPVTKVAICRMGAKEVGDGSGDMAYEVETEVDV